MRPIANLVRDFRSKKQLAQSELAAEMGYKQTLISSVEIGKRGPPSKEFLERFASVLELSPKERDALHDAADASQRKFLLDDDLPESAYWMLRDLRIRLPELGHAEIELLHQVLILTKVSASDPQREIRSARVRRKREAKM